MRRFRKSSTAVFTFLALGLMPVLPAAAQTMQGIPTGESTYTVRSSGTSQTGNDSADMPITITVEQKPGMEAEDFIITWKEDPRAKAAMGKDAGKHTAEHALVEYKIETAQRKGVSAQ